MLKPPDLCFGRKSSTCLCYTGFARDFSKAFADMHIPKDPPLNSVDPRLTENVGVYPHLVNDFSRFLSFLIFPVETFLEFGGVVDKLWCDIQYIFALSEL